MGEIINFDEVKSAAWQGSQIKKAKRQREKNPKTISKNKKFTIIHRDSLGQIKKIFHVIDTSLVLAISNYSANIISRKLVDGDMLQILKGHIYMKEETM